MREERKKKKKNRKGDWGGVISEVADKQMSFPGGTSSKELATNAGDVRDQVSIPGLRRSPVGGHDNPL